MANVAKCPVCGKNNPGESRCRGCGADLLDPDVRAMMTPIPGPLPVARPTPAPAVAPAALEAPIPAPAVAAPSMPTPAPAPTSAALPTIDFYCPCGTRLTAVLGTQFLQCHACRAVATVPGVAAPVPAAYGTPVAVPMPPPAPAQEVSSLGHVPGHPNPQQYPQQVDANAAIGRRPGTVVMRIIMGILLIGTGAVVTPALKDARDNQELFWVFALMIPAGIASIIAGLVEAGTKKKMNWFS